jgi:hypothetical protein
MEKFDKIIKKTEITINKTETPEIKIGNTPKNNDANILKNKNVPEENKENKENKNKITYDDGDKKSDGLQANTEAAAAKAKAAAEAEQKDKDEAAEKVAKEQVQEEKQDNTKVEPPKDF